MIHVENLCKTFHVPKRSTGTKAAVKAFFHREMTHIEAIKDVSFHVSPGEMVGYIGPNGAGKSTTIKIMSGILVPDSGTCSILGRTPWLERIEHVKHIGVVFGQRSQLWWDVPVQDSFELLRDIYQIDQCSFHKTLNQLTEILDMSLLLKTPVRTLSLGQRMRCELAASLLHKPQLLFLDEPTIGLDAVSKLAVRQFVRELNIKEETTVILTTHDMHDIEALTHRILLIGKGRILYDGGLENLRNRFDTIRTITVEYREEQNPPDVPGVRKEILAKGRVQYYIDMRCQSVASILSELSSKLDFQDISVGVQPVDELIVRLYQEHQI